MTAIRRSTLVPLIAALVLAAPPLSFASSSDVRTGVFYLELNGSPVGALRSASGGDLKAEEITENAGGGTIKKHIGSVSFSDVTLEIGAGMDPAVYQWLTAACDFKQQQISGAVVLAGYDFNVISRREFLGAMIAEVALPALDVASKDAAGFTVKLRPENVRISKGGGTVSSSQATQQRPWQASNFRLEIPGLDCTRIRHIEPIRWTTRLAVDAVGNSRDRSITPNSKEISDLTLTMPESSMDTWQDWAQQFMINGQSGDAQEKSGDLVLLGSDLQSEIARIHFSGLGIKGIATNPAEGAGAIRTAEVSLYCERAALDWKGGTGAIMNVRVFGK